MMDCKSLYESYFCLGKHNGTVLCGVGHFLAMVVMMNSMLISVGPSIAHQQHCFSRFLLLHPVNPLASNILQTLAMRNVMHELVGIPRSE